jgi:chitin disaccharide deacetylase
MHGQMSQHKASRSCVIINADDFGITEGVNKAIFELAKAGIITSTSVMSNMPGYKSIVHLKDKIGIGVHFNLTVGQPITDPNKIPSLVNNNGFFFDLSLLLKKTRNKVITKEEVEIEFEAQVRHLLDIGITPDHIDSHESLLKYPFFKETMKRVARRYKIPAVRTYIQRKFDYSRLLSPRKTLISLYLAFQKIRWESDRFCTADKYDSLIKSGLDYEAALRKLEAIFHNLPPGILEIGVHPGYLDANHELLGKYINEREVELQALSSDYFRQLLENSEAKLISFKDICNNGIYR